eukprot:6488986-Amphidinium_carterae.5
MAWVTLKTCTPSWKDVQMLAHSEERDLRFHGHPGPFPAARTVFLQSDPTVGYFQVTSCP